MPAELIVNGDFETDLAGTVPLFGAVLTRDGAHSATGAWALQLSTVESFIPVGVGFRTLAGGYLPATPGVSHHYQAQVWAEGAAVGRQWALTANWLTAAGAFIAQDLVIMPVAPGWNLLEVTAVAPPGTAFVNATLTTPGIPPTVVVWVDAVSLEAAIAAYVLLAAVAAFVVTAVAALTLFQAPAPRGTLSLTMPLRGEPIPLATPLSEARTLASALHRTLPLAAALRDRLAVASPLRATLPLSMPLHPET